METFAYILSYDHEIRNTVASLRRQKKKKPAGVESDIESLEMGQNKAANAGHVQEHNFWIGPRICRLRCSVHIERISAEGRRQRQLEASSIHDHRRVQQRSIQSAYLQQQTGWEGKREEVARRSEGGGGGRGEEGSRWMREKRDQQQEERAATVHGSARMQRSFLSSSFRV